MQIVRAIPIAIYAPSLSIAFLAILIAPKIKTRYKTIIAPATINPISSPITAKIKSVVLGYKYPKLSLISL